MSNWALLQEQLTGLPVAKRARNSIHFDKGGGEILAEFVGKPCHYLDGGIWKPIDTKLLLRGDGYYGCPHSKVKVKPDGTVAVEGTDYVQRTELPTAQTGLLDSDKLVRKFSFGEQRMWITEDGFKSEIQLNRIPTLTEAKKLIATESGTLSREYLKSLTTATDANGDEHTFTTLAKFRTWLESATYPVIIDPDFAGAASFGSASGYHGSVYATARSTATAQYTTFIAVGQYKNGAAYYTYRGFIKFDTSSIPDDNVVTQVNLTLTVTDDKSTTDYDVQIVKQDWSAQDPLAAGNREAAYDNCLAGTADANIWRNTSGMSLNTPYTSGNLATEYIDLNSPTYYSLRSSLDYAGTAPSGDERITVANSNNANQSYRPVLTILYASSGGVPKHFMHYQRMRSL